MIKCHLKTILKEHNLYQKGGFCDLIKARPSTPFATGAITTLRA